jgi:hypothetical protein
MEEESKTWPDGHLLYRMLHPNFAEFHFYALR